MSIGGVAYILISIIIEYLKKDGLVLNELKRVISFKEVIELNVE